MSLKCTNSSYGVYQSFLSADCSGNVYGPSIPMPGASCSNSPYYSFQITCVSENYTIPTVGLVVKTSYANTCPIAISSDSTVDYYTTGTCVAFKKATCLNSTHSALTAYTNSLDCTGTPTETSIMKNGCNLFGGAAVEVSCVANDPARVPSGAASTTVAMLSFVSLALAVATSAWM